MKKSTRRIFLSLLVGVGFVFNSVAGPQVLKLGSLFANGMVLQQKTDAAIWGSAVAGETVVISVSWLKTKTEVVVDADGSWKTKLKTPAAGGPYTVSIQCGSESIQLKDVLMGEVWICSGQSNMQWKMSGYGPDHWKAEIEQANYPTIRYCEVGNFLSLEAQDHVKARWSTCQPKTAKKYSAIAFFFGRELSKELEVPIGLISVNWGGSSAEAWVAPDTLAEQFPEFNTRLAEYPGIAKESGVVYTRSQKKPKGLNHRNPAVLYNGMIEPILTYAMRGVIWYQGESNVKNPKQYQTLFPALITDWRNRWGIGEFPFYYVQIAPYKYKANELSSAFLREAQMMALTVPNTGMAVTMDVGEKGNIHPRKKQPVAHRLAAMALSNTYGRKAVCSGPLYRSLKVESGQIRISFSDIGSGLASCDGEALRYFTIAGADQKFVEATATIEGGEVVVHAPEGMNPVAVRFGWGNADITNLSNKEGFPASSFRTDDWKIEI